MRRLLLFSTLVFALSGTVFAEDLVPAKEATRVSSSAPKTSVVLMGSPEIASQKDTLFLSPSESEAIGVLVDYQPFRSSGFNLSAGSVTSNQTYSLQTTLPIQRAYLGVGWKRLLDDAQNFGIRVDVGAIYDDHPELENRASNINSPNNADQPIVASDWIPVVSFGVSYRF